MGFSELLFSPQTSLCISNPVWILLAEWCCSDSMPWRTCWQMTQSTNWRPLGNPKLLQPSCLIRDVMDCLSTVLSSRKITSETHFCFDYFFVLKIFRKKRRSTLRYRSDFLLLMLCFKMMVCIICEENTPMGLLLKQLFRQIFPLRPV